MKSPWKSRGTVVFLLIAFGAPWTGWTLLNVLHPPHGTALWWSLFLTGCCCSVAGFVASYVESGWSGPKMFIQRTLHVRFPITWWLYAFFLFALGGIISTAIYGYAHGGIGPLKPFLSSRCSLLRPSFGWSQVRSERSLAGVVIYYLGYCRDIRLSRQRWFWA
jgi:hypothetical protein